METEGDEDIESKSTKSKGEAQQATLDSVQASRNGPKRRG